MQNHLLCLSVSQKLHDFKQIHKTLLFYYTPDTRNIDYCCACTCYEFTGLDGWREGTGGLLKAGGRGGGGFLPVFLEEGGGGGGGGALVGETGWDGGGALAEEAVGGGGADLEMGQQDLVCPLTG